MIQTVKIKKRGCGYPKEGGFYAIGSGAAAVCFALPVEMKPCSCCAQQPKQARCPTKVTSEYLHQMFSFCEKTEKCKGCIMDNHDYWISWIGSDYSKETFVKEVKTQGLSRRIPPSFAKAISPGDYFANAKGGKIISLVPITSVRYYVKPTDTAEKLAKIEEDGVELCKIEIEEEEPVAEQTSIDAIQD